jgi:DNA-binding PadR family transcriptional regulator
LLAERPAHGYELSKTFSGEGDLSSVCRLGLSQLYADLNKLESLGLVAEAADPSRAGKKVYSLADSGRRQLEQWLARPVSGASWLRVDFMAKLYFARRRGSQRVLIAEQARVLEEEIQGLREQRTVDGFRGEVAGAYEELAASGLAWLRKLS